MGRGSQPEEALPRLPSPPLFLSKEGIGMASRRMKIFQYQQSLGKLNSKPQRATISYPLGRLLEKQMNKVASTGEDVEMRTLCSVGRKIKYYRRPPAGTEPTHSKFPSQISSINYFSHSAPFLGVFLGSEEI